jgi:hypothetical protein
MLQLTELGAQLWAQGLKDRTAIPVGVKFMYEYLQMMPDVGARVSLNGRRAFEHLSGALSASYKSGVYGGSAKLEAEWQEMTRTGVVQIEFIGAGTPEIDKMRQELVSTFAKQAQEAWFKMLFEPMLPDAAAKAGTTEGGFGGVNFALKWKKESEAVDLNLELRFSGYTWMKASMDAGPEILSPADSSYLTEVRTQQSFPASVVIDADPQVSNVAVSIAFTEGHSPVAPVFGAEGGTAQYVVTSQTPDKVKVRYTAKVNFEPKRWPVIQSSGEATVVEGGNTVVIKPSAWIGRHWIYMFIRDGDRIVSLQDLSDDDYLICNVSYQGSKMSTAIKESARITPLEAIEFSYPIGEGDNAGQAKFSAFGVIGGKLVRSKEQPINFDEDAVFILASEEGIQLVSEASVLPESDNLAQRLLLAGARPLARGDGATRSGAHPEAGEEAERIPMGTREISGTVVAVEYGTHDSSLLIQSNGGPPQRVRLHKPEEADPFDDARKNVRVLLDEAGFAERILVRL